MFCVCMASDDDHARLIAALCELISKIWVQKRRVRTQGTPSAKVQSAREAARLAGERKAVEGNVESKPSMSSALEKKRSRKDLRRAKE